MTTVSSILLVSDISMNKQIQSPPRKSSLYWTCSKISLALLITALCLVPVVFLVGSQESYYYEKPFYSVLEQSQQLKGLRKQIDSELTKNAKDVSVINLYSCDASALKSQSYMAKEDTRRWQNLKQAAQYLGYWFNSHNRPTITSTIKYPSENVTSIAKDNLKQSTKKAYNLDLPSNPISYLRRKLAKTISNITTRFKWEEQDKTELRTYIKNYVLSLARKESQKKIWVVILAQDNEEYHHPTTLNKKIEEWRKEHKHDELIIVSRLPLDKFNKKISSIEVNIDKDALLYELQEMNSKKQHKLKLPFQVQNPRNVFSYLLRKNEGWLSKVSKFVQYCHENHVCRRTYTLLKQYIHLKYSIEGKLNSLCQIDQNYVNGLNEKDFQSNFGSIILELLVKDKKQFKKDLNILHNIIRADVCGNEELQQPATQEFEQNTEGEVKEEGEGGKKGKKEKNVKEGKGKKTTAKKEGKEKEKDSKQKKQKFEEKVKKAKLMQEQKLREAEEKEREEEQVLQVKTESTEQDPKVSKKKDVDEDLKVEQEETKNQEQTDNKGEKQIQVLPQEKEPLQPENTRREQQLQQKDQPYTQQPTETIQVDTLQEETIPEDHSLKEQQIEENSCNKKDGQICEDAEHIEEVKPSQTAEEVVIEQQ